MIILLRNAHMAVGTETPKKYQISWGFCFINKTNFPLHSLNPLLPLSLIPMGYPSPPIEVFI